MSNSDPRCIVVKVAAVALMVSSIAGETTAQQDPRVHDAIAAAYGMLCGCRCRSMDWPQR